VGMKAEELLNLRGDCRRELLYGELVEMPFHGAEHGLIAARIGVAVATFVQDRTCGVALAGGTGFWLATNPDLVRSPDAAFVRAARIRGCDPLGFFPGAPDLAVEVVSPGDTRREVAEKVNAGLAHGATSVWVADPTPMTTAVHRTGQQPAVFGFDQTLTDDAVLPGFSLAMSQVFGAIS
jgi:Uma2 family endonuclease